MHGVNTVNSSVMTNVTSQMTKSFNTRFIYSKKVSKTDVQGLLVRPLKQTFAVYHGKQVQSVCRSYADVVKKNAPHTRSGVAGECKVNSSQHDNTISTSIEPKGVKMAQVNQISTNNEVSISQAVDIAQPRLIYDVNDSKGDKFINSIIVSKQYKGPATKWQGVH